MLADVLMVIDMQKGVLSDNGREIYWRTDLLRRINKRIADYRLEHKAIIFVQHHDEGLIKDSAAWQLAEALDFQPTDIFVDKIHADSFYKTTLAEKLSALRAQSLSSVVRKRHFAWTQRSRRLLTAAIGCKCRRA